MSWIFQRKDVQLLVVIVTFLIQFIPYFFDWPGLMWLSTKLVTIASIIAAFSIILALLMFNEVITLLQFVGIIVIFVGVYFLAKR